MADYIAVPMQNQGHQNRRGRGYGGGRGRGRGRGWGRGGGRRGGGRQQGGRRHKGRHNLPRICDDDIEEIGSASPDSLSIAVEGCCHGELDSIYEKLKQHEKKTGQKIDLLLCCGDFQSLRNAADFHSSSIPPKYRSLGTFPKYYSGESKAPILTVFIGGNHEASQPLRELYYGGWVAPNIYYMGAAGVIRFGGIRIGGISGIYKSHDYSRGHHERVPYDRSSLRSAYHVRNVDVYRLASLSKDPKNSDIFLSHDWPLGIEQHGDTNDLLRRKPFFRDEVRQNCLGSPPNREILDEVQPRWWFSAHLHVKFKASVLHSNIATPQESSLELVPSQVTEQQVKSQDECHIDKGDLPSEMTKKEESITTANDEHDDGATKKRATEFKSLESSRTCNGPDLTDQMTQFLALDKCLPRRGYLSILHLPRDVAKEDNRLEYDAEWLAILRKTHNLTSRLPGRVRVPSTRTEISRSDIEWVETRLKNRNASLQLEIPENFQPTVPFYSDPCMRGHPNPFPMMGNPQTDRLLEILELSHIITIPHIEGGESVMQGRPHAKTSEGVANTDQIVDDNEIDISEGSDDSKEKEGTTLLQKELMSQMHSDDNEIDIEEAMDDSNSNTDNVCVEKESQKDSSNNQVSENLCDDGKVSRDTATDVVETEAKRARKV